MTFLLDQDTPDDLIYSLKALGHDAFPLREVLQPTTIDMEIFSFARKQNWILITCNRDDFLELAKGQSHPGLIILVRRKSRAMERAALVKLLDKAGEAGIAGNINFA